MFSDTKLVLLTADEKLKGFSGKNVVYVNCEAIDRLYSSLENKLLIEDKLTLFKLNFICIVVNELTKVVLRHVEGNLNSSILEVLSSSKSRDNESDLLERGVIAEEYLFGQRIDFIETPKMKNFSTGEGQKLAPSKYLKLLLDTIEEGICTLDQLKKMHDNSLTIASTEKILVQGVSCSGSFGTSGLSFTYE